MKKISEIINENGYPQLCINGEIQDGLAYITYLTENNRYIDFAKAGYRLFSVPVLFGFNHLNEHSGLNVFNIGIFDIFPRVNISISREWELRNPDELCDPYPDGTLSRTTFA